MSCRPSKGDRTRPSPRLPPSSNSKHHTDAHKKDGALVTAVGADLPEAVFTAVYAEVNARVQSEAMRLDPVTFLASGEVRAAAAANREQIGRTWRLWRQQADDERAFDPSGQDTGS